VNTNWGSSFHYRRRLLPPDYSDGVSEPRVATNGSPLPNTRLLSKELFNDKTNYSTRNTALYSMFGQFHAHDIARLIQLFGGALECCPINGSSLHPECLPIDDIPKDELSVYHKQDCINFVRTVSCNTCDLGRNYN
jgi:peroxidase